MKFSTRSRYGMRAMLDIAINGEGRLVLLKDIAERQDVSKRYLEHMMTQLRNSGLVTAERGAAGGYRLSRPPSEIRLDEIFEALEGEIAPVECLRDPSVCDRSEDCVSRELWDEMRAAMCDVLQGRTLEDLRRRWGEIQASRGVPAQVQDVRLSMTRETFEMAEYSDIVMEHFLNPRNVGEIEDADGIGEVGNPLCGDMMTFYIRVDGGRLSEVKFKTFGCGAAIAVSSMVSEMAAGRTLEEAERITREDIAERLGGLPSEKMHCSNLGADALRRAIRDYLDGRDEAKDGSSARTASAATGRTLEGSPSDDAILSELILEKKRERDAVILAHNYQRPEIQDIADFVGDSLGLALKASETRAKVIVFCGVHFMAETAAILNPDRIVLLPDIRAGCPMADMAPVDDVIRVKERHPNAAVVSYVNTTAAVKAESDYCCTSSNAVRVCREIDADEILFLPDRNLAAYVAGHLPEKKIIPWDGFCHVHQDIGANDVNEALAEHPGAQVIAHPECTREVIALADHVASTSGMISTALESGADEFVIATEAGMVYPLTRGAPGKSFHPTASQPLCPNMKLVTLPKVLLALETLEPRVVVPEGIRTRALLPVERMLRL